MGEYDKAVDPLYNLAQRERLDVLVLGWNAVAAALEPFGLPVDCAVMPTRSERIAFSVPPGAVTAKYEDFHESAVLKSKNQASKGPVRKNAYSSRDRSL